MDIGKTHSKVSLWSRNGRCLDKQSRANMQGPAEPYAVLDTAGIADWLVQALSKYAGQPVEAIVPVAHGAGVAGIRNGVLAFSPMDYEWAIPADVQQDYRKQRDPFAITGSPSLPAGLNFGAQLHYLESQGALAGATLLPWAQYWAWLLSGVMASEVSSLGCHSDVWAPGEASFSPMAQHRGWAAQFAPMARAGDAIGTLLPDLARLTGLPATAKVYAGLHDSNAALLAARGFPEIARREATVLSTGTWFIAMRCPAEALDLSALPEARDSLVNVDVEGRAVPSARYMGGRELELLGARIDHAGTDGVAEVLASGANLLPSQVKGCGPFPDAHGCWLDEPADPLQRSAAIALYAALMADISLDLIGARDRLLVEGRFARSEIFVRALAALRPGTQVWYASEEADVSFGALRLALPDLQPRGALYEVLPLAGDIRGYRDRWRENL